jgi:zinc resistance-associated protein
MWKTGSKIVLAAAAAAAIVGSSAVYAQQRNNDGMPGPDGQHHWRPSPEDITAFTDARVAALKAGLELTPDQAKNWPAFEQAYRDLAKLRADRMKARFEQRRDNPGANDQRAENVNPIDRLNRVADALTTRGTALKHLADAAGPLYQSLDDAQKRRFVMLSHALRAHRHEHFAAERMQHGQDGRGQQQ